MKSNKNKNGLRNIVLWVFIMVFALILSQAFSGAKVGTRLGFSDFIEYIDRGEIKSVLLRGDIMEGALPDGRKISTIVPHHYTGLVNSLNEKKVKIEAAPLETPLGTILSILISWFPVLLFIGVWIYFMKGMQGGAGRALGFGKSRAQLITKDKNRITFADVAGIDEAKEELIEIVDFLKDPSKFQRLGGKIPKGCLLVGHPGTGKTLLAKAIAGEARVPFFSISGSDFVEMFVGVGASRVRDMFGQAKKHAPAIVFIDEIDAVGRHRGAGLGGGNDEREQTLNQLLVEMDGFSDNQGVIIIAATNRPDVLDPALLRPGRFDRQVTVGLPDRAGREQIFKVHTRNVPLASDVDLGVMARRTPGLSGADIANVVNEGALLAARKDHRFITMKDLEDAIDKVLMGSLRKSIMKDDEKRRTAYHESGHAIVTLFSPAADQIHKMTIAPRGKALGMVMQLPEDDRYSVTKEQLESKIAIAMGGRVAEELIFGVEQVTSGASSDIKMATSIARRMVTQWGYSEAIGPVLVGDEREEVFLGHSLGHQRTISDKLAYIVDTEVKEIIDRNYKRAKEILETRIDMLNMLAATLLEQETMSGDEIMEALGIEKSTPESKNVNTSTAKQEAKLAKADTTETIKPTSSKKRASAKKKDEA